MAKKIVFFIMCLGVIGMFTSIDWTTETMKSFVCGMVVTGASFVIWCK